jgi:hypothetical protein
MDGNKEKPGKKNWNSPPELRSKFEFSNKPLSQNPTTIETLKDRSCKEQE